MAPCASGSRTGPPVFIGTISENVAVDPTNTRGLFREGKYLNVLFADWHVVPMRYAEEFADTTSDAGKKHWSPAHEERQP